MPSPPPTAATALRLACAVCAVTGLLASTAGNTLRAHTTVYSERRRASLMRADSVDSLLVASVAALAALALCARFKTAPFWPTERLLLARCAAMVAWQLAVDRATTDLQLVVLVALAIEAQHLGIAPLVWAAVIWSHVRGTGGEGDDNAAPAIDTSIALAVGALVDVAFHAALAYARWRREADTGKTRGRTTSATALYTPALATLAVIAALTRTST